MTDFDKFWEHYPLKKGKGYARKCFEKQQKAKILPSTENLIKSIHNQIAEKKHLREKNQFVAPWKHPSTWLNQECWDDICILPKSAVKRSIKPSSLDNMSRAYRMLTQFGQDQFQSYCKQLRMPPEDIEAVLCKHNGTHDLNKLPQMRSV